MTPQVTILVSLLCFVLKLDKSIGNGRTLSDAIYASYVQDIDSSLLE